MTIFPWALGWLVVVTALIRTTLTLVGRFWQLFCGLLYDISSKLVLFLTRRSLCVSVGRERANFEDWNFCVT